MPNTKTTPTTDRNWDVDRCPSCGSSHITVREGDFPTGVTAPDGGAEIRHQVFIHCRACGAKEEA